MMNLKILFLAIFCIVINLTIINTEFFSNYDNNLKKIHQRFARQIAPGTKWCGNGDKANNDTDLGYFHKTDACCREHDKCPLNIAGHETKYGLTNPDLSTRSYCDCDKKFYECLTNASTGMSRAIGEIYFNFLSKKCFRKKECPPEIACDEYEWADGTTWLPTRDELRRMYRLMALIQPELEIDPSEDDLIDLF